MFTDTFMCIDGTVNLVPSAEVYLGIVSGTWAISVVLTIYLGIRHFRKVRKLKKKKRNEFE